MLLSAADKEKNPDYLNVISEILLNGFNENLAAQWNSEQVEGKCGPWPYLFLSYTMRSQDLLNSFSKRVYQLIEKHRSQLDHHQINCVSVIIVNIASIGMEQKNKNLVQFPQYVIDAVSYHSQEEFLWLVRFLMAIVRTAIVNFSQVIVVADLESLPPNDKLMPRTTGKIPSNRL